MTDDGLRHLSRLSGLRRLNLGGCSISDRGLEVLRRLPALEIIGLAWTPITDAGAAHLAACDRLRQVDLAGTASGDGAIRALAGKRQLADFRSGEEVTNDGLSLLRELPVFRTWHGGEEYMALLSPDARPNVAAPSAEILRQLQSDNRSDAADPQRHGVPAPWARSRTGRPIP